jgi:hypothetical protein
LVYAFAKSPIAAKDHLILEQCRETISKVFSRLAPLSSPNQRAVSTVTLNRRRSGILIDLNEAVEADDDMCDPRRLDHFQVHTATDDVALRILLVWIIQGNVIIGDVARFGRER